MELDETVDQMGKFIRLPLMLSFQDMGWFVAVFLATMTPSYVQAQTVKWKTDIQFGKLATDGTSGTVKIKAKNGKKKVSGGVIDFGGTSGQGELKIKGRKGSKVILTLPRHARIKFGNKFMRVDTFKASKKNPIKLKKKGRNAGTATIGIGATLQVSANQSAGDPYTGTMPFFVEYQ